ncbi:MAG: peptide-methionine (S)-S-oxide reductase MsrA, partial [Candidatus Rokuibacteriota bacterium]
AFAGVEGVVSTQVGYTGGHKDSPTYKEVCTGATGHAEAVEVQYDPDVIDYEGLLDVFWGSHDPTTLDRQGPDVGTQYRSAIFFHDADQEKAARASREALQASGKLARPIVTKIEPVSIFHRAEEYHQRYFEKNGVVCHRP